MVASEEKNYYEMLEISTSATLEEIKSSYRKLARKYHPDVTGGDKKCEEKFKEITSAYETLSDATKKKRYDILRGIYNYNRESAEEKAVKSSEAKKAYSETKKEPRKEKPEEKQGFSNVFNDILDGFKNNSAKDKAEENIPKPVNGSDINTDVSITINEARDGISKTVNILTTELCPKCKGRPFVNGTKCNACDGKGEKTNHKKITVKIPAQVKHGSKIRIPNEGNEGQFGGKNGDLYLQVKIEAEKNFEYSGENINCTIPITPYEAVLGTTINIPTPEVNVAMKIMPNTSSGQKYRIAGQGLKKGDKTGDIIVTVNIEVPKNPSKEEIKLYEKLKEISTQKVR